jgi:hypothetical protein
VEILKEIGFSDIQIDTFLKNNIVKSQEGDPSV